MKSHSHRAHSSLESQVAERYRQQGFEVIEEPSSEDLPFDLGAYRPDLLVKRSDDEGLIVEIKSTFARLPVERYREIAETVAQHPGWRFLLVTAEDAYPGIESPDEHLLPSGEQIVRRKEQIERLISIGETQGAFLLLWALLEALLRKRAIQTALPIERFPTASLINHLYSQGELSIGQFDRAVALHSFRNRIAHGLEVPDAINSLTELQRLVNELMNQWAPEGL